MYLLISVMVQKEFKFEGLKCYIIRPFSPFSLLVHKPGAQNNYLRRKGRTMVKSRQGGGQLRKGTRTNYLKIPEEGHLTEVVRSHKRKVTSQSRARNTTGVSTSLESSPRKGRSQSHKRSPSGSRTSCEEM